MFALTAECEFVTIEISIEPERVSNPKSASHLWSELFNKGQMVAIQSVTDIEKVERNDVRSMLLRDQVRTRKVKDRIAGSWCFRRENLVLVIRHHHFRIYQQAFVSQFESDSAAQWRNPWQRCVGLRKMGLNIVEAQVEPDSRMKGGVKARLCSSVPSGSLNVFRFGQIVNNVSGRGQEDEVLEVVIKTIRFEPQSLR